MHYDFHIHIGDQNKLFLPMHISLGFSLVYFTHANMEKMWI